MCDRCLAGMSRGFLCKPVTTRIGHACSRSDQGFHSLLEQYIDYLEI